MIELKKVESVFQLKCPCCGEPRLLAKSDAVEVPGGGYWLSDGDTIPHLYQDLVAAGLEKEHPADDPNFDTCNYDYELLVGECPKCGVEYMVIEAGMIDPAVEVDAEFVDSYFHGNADIAPQNFIARLPGKDMEWLAHRYDTDKGVALIHVFGPFDLKGKTMKGPVGVAACSSGDMETWDFARKMLFELWPDLKVLATAINAAPAADPLS